MNEWMDHQILHQRREDLIREVERQRLTKELRTQRRARARRSRERARWRKDLPIEGEKAGDVRSGRSPVFLRQLRGCAERVSQPDPSSATTKGFRRSRPVDAARPRRRPPHGGVRGRIAWWRRVGARCARTTNRGAATLETRHEC